MHTITILRHLKDIDNLRDYGRDGGLVPGQEPEAAEIARQLGSEALEVGCKAILFVSSDRLRTIQTVELIRDSLKANDSTRHLKLAHAQQPALAALGQGEFNLPHDYQPGDFYHGLPLAEKAYVAETGGDQPNYHYRFGDPVQLPDGTDKHPALRPYFKEYGESSRDNLLRIYGQARTLCRNISRVGRQVKLVVVTHAQLYQVYTSLTVVTQRIRSGHLAFTAGGQLPPYCWNLYRQRMTALAGREREFPALHIPCTDLLDDRLIHALDQEIAFLQSLA